MSAFTISPSALAEIRRILLDSQCRDPVARLYERADTRGLFDDLSTELMAGGKTDEDFRARGKDRLQQVGGQLESCLVVSACERVDIQADDLLKIGDITFAMNAAAAELLRDCCLTIENGVFVLRGSDNKAYTLRSLSEALRTRGPS
jgi:hypothetical protein